MSLVTLEAPQSKGSFNIETTPEREEILTPFSKYAREWFEIDY